MLLWNISSAILCQCYCKITLPWVTGLTRSVTHHCCLLALNNVRELFPTVIFLVSQLKKFRRLVFFSFSEHECYREPVKVGELYKAISDHNKRKLFCCRSILLRILRLNFHWLSCLKTTIVNSTKIYSPIGRCSTQEIRIG